MSFLSIVHDTSVSVKSVGSKTLKSPCWPWSQTRSSAYHDIKFFFREISILSSSFSTIHRSVSNLLAQDFELTLLALVTNSWLCKSWFRASFSRHIDLVKPLLHDTSVSVKSLAGLGVMLSSSFFATHWPVLNLLTKDFEITLLALGSQTCGSARHVVKLLFCDTLASVNLLTQHFELIL